MATQPINTAKPQLNKLAAFRQAIYTCFLKAGDVLFEIIDALLLSPGLSSFPELSSVPVFRRQWPSLYEGLEDGKVDQAKLLETLIEQLPGSERPVLVGDHTTWARAQARTLKDRSFQHQPTPIKGQKPITIGHGYSTLGVVPEVTLADPEKTEQKSAGSWFLPLLHERIKSTETPAQKAAEQLKQVCQELDSRPLALYDSEYGSGVFLNLTAGLPCDLFFRVRPNRKLRRAPSYKGNGRRPLHGPVFRLGDPQTWGQADEEWEFADPKLGRVRIQRWNELHFEEAPKRIVTLFRIERLQARGTRRDPRVVWLGYCGEEALPRHSAEWREYLNRFVIEHWYRFIKQSLNWTLPRLGTPEQSELWSLLVILAYWQLWLARAVVADSPRPWQKPQSELTPGRVQQGIGGVLATIGTPASEPKPRGTAPGWPEGQPRTKRPRYEVVKKSSKNTKKVTKQAVKVDKPPS